jgi:glycosyltransferase involved in cell wall biosynthesis
VAGLNRADVRLVLVGAGELPGAREATAAAREALGDRVTVFGMQPFARVPEFISAADVVVVPQRRTRATQWQMPAKIFDAMAMARPVVATAVSDIPAVLDGCGWVVDPDSPDALARAIAEVIDDPARAEAAGAEARSRCVERYSWDAMERTLTNVFAQLESAV